ncbi:MAG: response regulator [Chloroflexota bacterium]|nr:response regulator [Chloroflexota bacterium]
MIPDRGRVLVVDDEPGVAMVLTELLEGEGYDVRHTANGHEALQVAAEWVPDVVVLDLTLPGMNGAEVARRLRALPDVAVSQVPIVVVTGAHAGIGTASDIGAFAAIRKPFGLDRVLSAVQGAVEASRTLV